MKKSYLLSLLLLSFLTTNVVAMHDDGSMYDTENPGDVSVYENEDRADQYAASTDNSPAISPIQRSANPRTNFFKTSFRLGCKFGAYCLGAFAVSTTIIGCLLDEPAHKLIAFVVPSCFLISKISGRKQRALAAEKAKLKQEAREQAIAAQEAKEQEETSSDSDSGTNSDSDSDEKDPEGRETATPTPDQIDSENQTAREQAAQKKCPADLALELLNKKAAHWNSQR